MTRSAINRRCSGPANRIRRRGVACAGGCTTAPVDTTWFALAGRARSFVAHLLDSDPRRFFWHYYTGQYCLEVVMMYFKGMPVRALLVVGVAVVGLAGCGEPKTPAASLKSCTFCRAPQARTRRYRTIDLEKLNSEDDLPCQGFDHAKVAHTPSAS